MPRIEKIWERIKEEQEVLSKQGIVQDGDRLETNRVYIKGVRDVRDDIDETGKLTETRDVSPTLPSITRRVLSTIVDGWICTVVALVSFYAFQDEELLYLRVGIPLFFSLFYEPFLVSTCHTIGQKIFNIRVRDVNTLTRISFPRAFIRFIVKIFLGIISFFSIVFSKKKRAIHDFVAGTIVIEG